MIEIVPNWHPLFVHFTVALLSLSVLFFIIQRPLAETEIGDNFLVFARYTLFLGILFTIGTVIAGIDAFNTVKHDDPSHLAMKDHRLWAILTASIFLLAWIWSLISVRTEGKASLVLIVILLLGAGLLVTTGHKGSMLVYYYGLGVEALPETDSHDHAAHDHDAPHEHAGSSEHGKEAEHAPVAQHDHAPAADMKNTLPSDVSSEKSHSHSSHDHATAEPGAATSQSTAQPDAVTAPQAEPEIIQDKDGIVRETLPEVVMPVEQVEPQ